MFSFFQAEIRAPIGNFTEIYLCRSQKTENCEEMEECVCWPCRRDPDGGSEASAVFLGNAAENFALEIRVGLVTSNGGDTAFSTSWFLERNYYNRYRIPIFISKPRSYKVYFFEKS